MELATREEHIASLRHDAKALSAELASVRRTASAPRPAAARASSTTPVRASTPPAARSAGHLAAVADEARGATAAGVSRTAQLLRERARRRQGGAVEQGRSASMGDVRGRSATPSRAE